MTQEKAAHRAREYETIVILNPDASQENIDKVASRTQKVITEFDGKLLKAENWGRRKLAYPVQKNLKGVYIYLRYLGYGPLVHELERNYRTLDVIIKFMTVKIDVDVDPAARPVTESEISFISAFDDVEAVETEEKVSDKEESPESGEAGTAVEDKKDDSDDAAKPAESDEKKEAEEAPVTEDKE